MQTRFLSAITTTLNPFSLSAKTPRLFLARLPSTVRNTVKISVKQLPRASKLPSTLYLKFTDGKEMSFEFPDRTTTTTTTNTTTAKQDEGKETGAVKGLNINDVLEEVERHTRKLKRQEDLTG